MEKLKLIRYEFTWTIFIALEILLLWLLFSFIGTYMVLGGVGGNVTVITQLTVGNVYPEVLSVSIDGGNTTLTLIGNSTKTVYCVALLRDYSNDTDINYSYADFYGMNESNFTGTDDKNWHYSNDSCFINYTFDTWNGTSDDSYLALATCTFNVWYNAHPGEWNCTVYVNDSMNWNSTGSDNITIQELLSIDLPSTINYGIVNATEVSNENVTNVTNVGNVEVNISLFGYAVNESGDNLAMNCTRGNLKNISIEYEKYNLTGANNSWFNLDLMNLNYINLTGSPVVKEFNLDSREEEAVNEATKSTYWRIYVPIGVAGTCRGNIVFGATKSAGS